MANPNLGLSPIQWLVYFVEHPSIFLEMVDIQIQLKELPVVAPVDPETRKPKPPGGEAPAPDPEAVEMVIAAGAEILAPHVDEIEKFQNDFLKRVGTTTTEGDYKEELINTVRGRGTAEARSGGVSTVKDLVPVVREKYETKPDTEGMTPAEATTANQEWYAEQQQGLHDANRLEGGDDAAAQAMADDMNEKVTIQSINDVVSTANKCLRHAVLYPPTATPAVRSSSKKASKKSHKEEVPVGGGFNP